MFAFSKTGTREAVIKSINAIEVPAQSDTPDPSKPDASQLSGLKLFMVSEISSLPSKFNGVRIDVNAEAHANGRSAQVVLTPLVLEV